MLDIEGALRDWGNSQAALVGQGKPLALGFHSIHPRSPGRNCYAILDVSGGGDGLTAEGVTGWASVTATVYAVTDKDAARVAALALVEALESINMQHPVVSSRGVQLIMSARTSWPAFEDNGDEPSYRVETEIHACAA